MKILFQGDSITDAHRDRSDAHNLSGYTAYVAQILGDGNEYVNLGISGDRTADLLGRYAADVKAVKPDVLTVLIGINDIWRRYDSNDFTPAEKSEANLEKFLAAVKKDLPNTKIILIEPFLLPAPDKIHWRGDLARLTVGFRRLALAYADGYVPMDGLFAKECLKTDWRLLSEDGVHPADKGHRLIAGYLAAEIAELTK